MEPYTQFNMWFFTPLMRIMTPFQFSSPIRVQLHAVTHSLKTEAVSVAYTGIKSTKKTCLYVSSSRVFHRRTRVYSEGTNNRKSISYFCFCTLPSHKCVCVRACVCDGLGHDAEHRVVAADAWADLLVVLLGVTHLVELRLKSRQTQRHKSV